MLLFPLIVSLYLSPGLVELRVGGEKGLGGNKDVLQNDKPIEYELLTRKGKVAMGPRGKSKIYVRCGMPLMTDYKCH